MQRTQRRFVKFECRGFARERVAGSGRETPGFGRGAAQARPAGGRDQRGVERGQKLEKAALRDEFRVARDLALGILACRKWKHRNVRRVHGGLSDDAGRGALPGLAVAVAHAPQIDLRLDDEDALDVAPDDAQERRVAVAERLLGVDEVQHGVGARQIREGGAPVGRIDRREPGRIGHDEAVGQKFRVDRDPHERGRTALVGDGVVELRLFADRDEPRQPSERDPLFAAVAEVRGGPFFGGVLEFGDRRRGRVDVGCEQTHDARDAHPIFVRHFAQQSVEQKRFAARKLTDHRENEAAVAQAAQRALELLAILLLVVPAGHSRQQRANFGQRADDAVAGAAVFDKGLV